MPYVRSYWRFYLTMWDRADLLAKTKEFDARSLGSIDLPANSYLLSGATDAATGATRRLTEKSPPGRAPRPEACVVSPDGQLVAYVRPTDQNGVSLNQIHVCDCLNGR